MNKKTIFKIIGVLALLLAALLSYLKYNMPISGKKIFPKELSLDLVSIYESNTAHESHTATPYQKLKEEDKERILEYFMGAGYTRKEDKVFVNSKKIYRIFGKSDGEIFIFMNDKYVLSSTKENKSDFYRISKESADKIMEILDKYK